MTSGIFQGVSLIVDCTECPINRPTENQHLLYSAKKKKHCIKYQLVVRILDGLIIAVEGPYMGSQHDLTIWKESAFRALFLEEDELVLGDKAYIGHNQMIVPWKKNQIVYLWQWAFNLYLAHYRIVVEQTIGKIKFFKCFQTRWRNELELHPVAFYVVSHIVNIEMNI